MTGIVPVRTPSGLICDASQAWPSTLARRNPSQVNRLAFFLGLAASICLANFAHAADDEPIDESDRGSAASSSIIERSPGPAQQVSLADWQTRYQQYRKQSKATGPRYATAETPTLYGLADIAYYGTSYATGQPARYIAVRVQLANLTSREITIGPTDFDVLVDGQPHPHPGPEVEQQDFTFSYLQQTWSVQQVYWKAPVSLTPNSVTPIWFLRTGLPNLSDVPPTTIGLRTDAAQFSLDVLDQLRVQLDLKGRRLGPQKCLAIVEVARVLGTVEAQVLSNHLAELATQNVSRVVVDFSAGGVISDAQLMSWLLNSAIADDDQLPRSEQYPAWPVGVQGLRVTGLSQDQLSAFGWNSQHHDHDIDHDISQRSQPQLSLSDGAQELLTPVYRQLSHSELLTAFRSKEPIEQLSALRAAGPKLADEDTLVLLDLTGQSQSPEVREVATNVLASLGSTDAIRFASQAALSENRAIATAAIEGLANSRFAAGRQLLQQLLTRFSDDQRQTLMRVLARHPRPEWSELLFEYITKSDRYRSGDALAALVKVGHPQLGMVLGEALHSPTPSVRKLAFGELVRRGGAADEQLALDYTLAFLEHSPPNSPTMSQFLTRTCDPRALPLLWRHLKEANNKASLIHLITEMSDESVVPQLVEMYPTFQPTEQAAVLYAVNGLDSAAFLTLARRALASRQPAVVNAAIDGLKRSLSPEAVSILIEALAETRELAVLGQLATALAAVGNDDARKALIQLRKSPQPEFRSIATAALSGLQARSPAQMFIDQARTSEAANNQDDALFLYREAIQADPYLADAYAGRGEILHKQKQPIQALADFEKACELDPINGLAQSGVAVCLVGLHRVDEALSRLAEARKELSKDMNFLYNAACAYSLASAELLANNPTAEQNERATTCREQAAADLLEAIRLGYTDHAWLLEDSDLEPLRASPEFSPVKARIAGN
jgi:tetratricopeptide (TPR) repeat protein